MRNIHASTGAGRTARQIVEHLARRPDVRLEILADAQDMQQVLPRMEEPWTQFRYHTFSSDTSRQQARWFLLDRPKAERFWPKTQVVFCTGESYVPVKKSRLVVTTHDAGYFETDAHTHDASYWKQRFKWNLLFRKLDRHADLFHTVSAFSAERLAHFFPAIASRIRPVHNGVTPHFFGPITSQGLTSVATAGLLERPFVLVPGGLHYRKNADLILSASKTLLDRCPDLVIAVVNHSNPSYAKQVEALGSRFRMLGFVSDEVLHALYASARLVWFPSRYEGFGLPVVEAMACGTPVIASDSSSIPEIAGGAAVLLPPTDVSAHVEAVVTLLMNDSEHNRYAAAGFERAKRFTWEKTAYELKRLFDGLL
ncbi:glycosyltransferase family 4 protein [Silvibacterium sp.]|uniref:glycosyltransferase family 4 protein n=1 Tax=Silvibacterium sp. TaxID=1964179 RepID=UPI0039E6390A